MKQKKFSLFKRIKSFRFAFNGLKILIKEEHNSRMHLFASVVILIAGIAFKLSPFEWIAIVFAIGFVLAFEIMNSAIENIADFISPEKHEKIKMIKDLAAAGVLVSAFTSIIIGFIVFLPKILELLLFSDLTTI